MTVSSSHGIPAVVQRHSLAPRAAHMKKTWFSLQARKTWTQPTLMHYNWFITASDERTSGECEERAPNSWRNPEKILRGGNRVVERTPKAQGIKAS